MAWLADLFSGLSLVAVVVVGGWSIKIGYRAAAASERSANAAVQAAEATQRSVRASQESAEAAKEAARIAEQDARVRRLESAVDAVLHLRDLFNQEHAIEKCPGGPTPLEPLEVIAARRQIEARLPALTIYDDAQLARLRYLVGQRPWANSPMEEAISELQQLIAATVVTDGTTP